MLSRVALVAEGGIVSASDLTQASAALQKQATRDFSPLWNVSATVDAFTNLEDVPVGSWPVILKKNIDVQNAAGVHEDKDGQPFALVSVDANWSLTASHETLEMLADPFGNRLVEGPSLDPNRPDRVQYLLEVADPCESAVYSYTIDGIVVSDFITPQFHDPEESSGARYSFAGNINHPRQVLNGGYISWTDPATGHWYQLFVDDNGNPMPITDLGTLSRSTEGTAVQSWRSTIDRLTPRQDGPKNPLTATELNKLLAMRGATPTQAARVGRARSLRAQIASLGVQG